METIFNYICYLSLYVYIPFGTLNNNEGGAGFSILQPTNLKSGTGLLEKCKPLPLKNLNL